MTTLKRLSHHSSADSKPVDNTNRTAKACKLKQKTLLISELNFGISHIVYAYADDVSRRHVRKRPLFIR